MNFKTNIKKPLFFACILLSTSVLGFGQSANSQVPSSKISEAAVASSSKRSKISASKEIKRGWKNFQADGIKLKLPSYYEGGNVKKNPQEVLKRIEKAGVPSGSIASNDIKAYDFFCY